MDTFRFNLNGVVPSRDIISWTESEVRAIKNNFLGFLGKKKNTVSRLAYIFLQTNADAQRNARRVEIFVDFQRRLVRTDSGIYFN